MSQGWSKIFNRINWLNRPSTNTPLNATNLNAGDSAIDKLDDRIITLDTVKADMQVVNGMVADISVNDADGVITVTYKNGSTKTYDTNLEKIATNFTYDYSTQRLVLTLSDGSKQYVDMSALITQYEFKDSATIAFSVDSTGKISASVKNGSITDAMLETGYLANITAQATKAESMANSATTSSNSAYDNAKLSQSYAIGGSGIREGEDTDNAMYYYEQAKKTDIGQIRSEVDELNSNLDTLEFSELSATSNIFGGDLLAKKIVENGGTQSNETVSFNNEQIGVLFSNFKENTQYTFIIKGKSTKTNSNIRIEYTDGTFTYCILSNADTVETKAVVSSKGKTIKNIESFYSSEATTTLYYDECGVFEGVKTVSDYEPCIPSVKMLAEEVNQQNENLADYGLDNKFANGLAYGYCSYSGGNFSFEDLTENDSYIGSKTEYSCVGGEPLKILFSQTMEQITIQFNNNSFFTVNNVDKIETVVPSGVTKLSFYVKKNGIKISNIGYIGIYINNQIDSLKNDLSGNDKVVIPLLNSCTGDLYYHKIGDLIVVNGVVNIPKANENIKVAVLPNSKVNQANAFTIYNFTDDTHDSEYATRYASDSSLVVKVPIANKDYIISGCYIGN